MSHFKTLKLLDCTLRLRFLSVARLPITIKYVDPTYQVRAVAANPNDSSLVGATNGQFYINLIYVILTCFPWLF